MPLNLNKKQTPIDNYLQINIYLPPSVFNWENKMILSVGGMTMFG